jgi:LPS-assembly protein
MFKNVPVKADHSLPFLDSKVRLVKNWQLSNLTVVGQYTDNFASLSNDATLQKYPEITWTVIEHPLFGSPLHAALNSSYDYYYREEGQKGHLFDVSPVFSLPINLLGTLQLTPFLGLQETLWEREDDIAGGDDKHGDRALYRAGANLNMELHRIFDVKGKMVEKIRHEIKPELVYTYVPHVDQNDVPDFATAADEQNTLAYALTHTLIGRIKGEDGKISYREILRFKISQIYYIEEGTDDPVETGRHPQHFSDINMELDVLPLKYCKFQLQNRYDVNDSEWKQTNYDFNVSDVRGDAAAVEYRYTKDAIEEINFHLKAALTKAVDATYTYRKNMLNDRTVESTYGIRFRRQCWNLELSYSDSESDRNVMLGISLLGLGRLGGP